MTASLQFDPVEHVYLIDGKKIPGVTELLAPLYDWAGIPQANLDYAKERGSFVHKACELYDLQVLDEDSIDEVVRPYLDAWIKFKHDTGFLCNFIETPMAHPSLRFAGTPDRTGVMTKLKGQPSCVVDIKAVTKMSRVTGVQLSAYKKLAYVNDADVELRYGVQLLPTGKYRLHTFTDPEDDACFMAQLITYQWRLKNG